MSWEPHRSSSQSSNRWKPPSPVSSAPPVPLPTITRETWKPESSWAPKGRAPPDPVGPTAERFDHGGPTYMVDQKQNNPPTSPRRRERIQYEETGPERRGGGGWQRDRFGKGGNREEDRSWDAWNNKISHVKREDDRRAGPSRPADAHTSHDRRQEMKDEADGRSWSAWKSKVDGVGTDDRRRVNEPVRGRERDEGWGARRKVSEELRNPGVNRRDGDDRNWAAYKDKRDERLREDDRPARPPPPQRPRAGSRSASPSTDGRRTPIGPRKPVQPTAETRNSPPPRRGIARRDSPEYTLVPRPRAPLPADSRAQVRSRGSPDYGIGGGDRNDVPVRGRSPSPVRRRDIPSPRAHRRDSSTSRSTSTPRRPRSPVADTRSAPPRRTPSPEFRAKRPRRQSPDYNPDVRRSPSPPQPVTRHAHKAPLPPQSAIFNKAGPVPARGPSLASQFARMDNTDSQTWRRPGDRPPPTGPHSLRLGPDFRDDRGPVERRPSPDYSRAGPLEHEFHRSAPRPPLPFGRPHPRPIDTAGLPYDTAQNAETGFRPAPQQPLLHEDASSLHPARDIPPVPLDHPNGATSPVKITLIQSPVKVGPPAGTPGLRQFFEAASPKHDRDWTAPSNAHASSDSGSQMDIESAAPSPAPDTSSQQTIDVAEQKAESQRKYNEHLSTIAPYLRSAFNEWLPQAQSTPISAFLVHYFGRQPEERELRSVEHLMNLRDGLSKTDKNGTDQAGGTIVQNQAPSGYQQQQAIASISESNGHAGQPKEADSSISKLLPGEAYERLACVGEGTYGKVYKARRVEDGVFVALKRIRMEGEKDGFPVTAMREIKLLQSLKQENIIRLHEMMVSKGSVYMVFDYMEHDLTGVLSHASISFSPANLKSLTHQMIAGLEYLHKTGILHRDMKGSNILLTAEGDLKLADFGLARLYNRKRKADYTNRVITLWYRSPELLMGETMYGPEVDMWSAGCIMLEMFFTKPILQGNDEIHQLEVINSIMGTPREDDWPQVRDLPWYELVKPKVELRSKFRESFSKRLSPAAMDLAEGLLAMNPAKRLSASKALQMPYFLTEEPPMEKPTQLQGIGEHHEMSAKQERQRRKAGSR